MIDVRFDFTLDSPGYWNHFWENRDGLGSGSTDPDSVSQTLRKYHRILWSKTLPNGETMELQCAPDYLTWNGFRFGSDSILTSFRYRDNRKLIEAVTEMLPDYKAFVEDYLHKFYTIGGMIVFPKHRSSINQCKGTNPLIRDRWDLTLECIRRFYLGESSPLYLTLVQDKAFFDLFVDFRQYVDYFFLQDCVSEDYTRVNIWLGKGDFCENPLPKSVDEYLLFIGQEMDFLEKRNKRIEKRDTTTEVYQ